MAGLAVLVSLLFAQVLFHEFVDYDDPDYVLKNPYVRAGLSREGLVWAFGRVHGEATYYHPLTWCSHMLDCQLFGLNPAWHHAGNVVFHVFNTLLVFLVLRTLAGSVWRSAMVAALFGIHPLQVDTVAWVAERKNVLSTLFWLLTILAYARYVARFRAREKLLTVPTKSGSQFSLRQKMLRIVSLDYALVVGLFGLGLLCKPMLVTLPCVLLLLDYWPLKRIPALSRSGQLSLPTFAKGIGPLVLEKLPLFILSGIFSVLTVLAHKGLGIIATAEAAPLSARLTNSIMSYGRYVKKILWPNDLAVLYLYVPSWPKWQVAGVALFLLAIFVLIFRTGRKAPYLAVGWLWFFGALVPVSGIVQAGGQSLADRFVYVPIIGFLFAAVWGIADLMQRWHWNKQVCVGIAALAITSSVVLTSWQLRHWKNTGTLFSHVITVTSGNHLAHNGLGLWYASREDFDSAIMHYRKALEINPDYEAAHNNLGLALASKGNYAEAIGSYQTALKLKPTYVEAHANLGHTLVEVGRIDEGIEHLKTALASAPTHASLANSKAVVVFQVQAIAHNAMGVALALKGQMEQATKHLHEAVRLDPTSSVALRNLGNAMAAQEQFSEAVNQYRSSLKLNDKDPETHVNLANTLMALGREDEAMEHYRVGLRLRPGNAGAHYNYGVALAKQGNRAEAAQQLREALRLNPAHPQAMQQLNALGSQ